MLEAVAAPEAPESQVPEEIKNIGKTTKRGFVPGERLKNRGLRKASITLFLEEELGVELGWAYDTYDALGNVVGHVQEGVVGELEKLIQKRDSDVARAEAEASLVEPEQRAAAQAIVESLIEEYVEPIKELETRRDELIAELTRTGFTLQLRAVPPIIRKDQHRKAKMVLGIEGKNIPEDRDEEFELVERAHLMSVIIQSITDNQTGDVNSDINYMDCLDLIGWLPPGQYQRLDAKLGLVQFTDAISQTIEAQEDFS